MKAFEAIYLPLRERFHSARAEAFIRLMRPEPGLRLLDLGGGDGSFAARITERIMLDVTVAEPEPTRLAAEERGFSIEHVTAGEPLPFEDNSFDIVLCNSVIEHATCWRGDTEGSWTERAHRAQRRFAAEIRRVAPAYFVQTPHADFPVDAHLLLPGTNWLPHSATERVVRFTDRYWIKKCGVADWLLLRGERMNEIFPDGRIHIERTLGLPKSLIAYKPVRVHKHVQAEREAAQRETIEAVLAQRGLEGEELTKAVDEFIGAQASEDPGAEWDGVRQTTGLSGETVNPNRVDGQDILGQDWLRIAEAEQARKG